MRTFTLTQADALPFVGNIILRKSLTGMGLNDGGVKRGDREDTGDLEAQHKDGVSRQGSGVRAGDEGPSGGATATGRTVAPSYPLVEHGDAEGYIDNEEESAKEK